MPYARLLLAQLAIGAAAIFARYALTGAGPIVVSALRLALATVVALAFARRLRPLGRRRELSACGAGVLLAIHFATWIGSLQYAPVAISTLFVTTTPIWTQTYDALRYEHRPTRASVVAFALAAAGIIAVALDRASTPVPIAGHVLRGDALALLGGLAIGAYLLVMRDAGTLADGTRVPTRQLVARTYGWAALVLLVASAFAGEGPPPLGDAVAWGGILAMAFVSQALGHTALAAALRDFTPTTVAMTTLLEPAIAAVLAAAIFGERIGGIAACGAFGIAIAIVVALRAERRRV